MKPDVSIFDLPDIDADEQAILAGEADADAGRVVSHEEVGEWLLKRGTPEQVPMPESWLK